MDQIQQRISSREVAEMLSTQHKVLLEKIDNINKSFSTAENSALQINVGKYWIEGQYKDANNRGRRELLISKRGCEFLAHKSTGKKGNLFTDKYMDRFIELEQAILKSRPMSALEQLGLQGQAILEVNDKVDEVKNDLEEFKKDLPLLGCDMDRITTAVKKIGVKCLGGKESNSYNSKSIRNKVYQDIYKQLKRQFGVTTYKSIKRNQCDTAVHIIEYYQLPIVLKEEINGSNAQESLAM